MDDLENYVASGLREDEAIAEELSNSISQTLSLFAKITFKGVTEPQGRTTQPALPSLWPYWVLDKDRAASRKIPQKDSWPEGRISQSTTSMIVAAIAAAGEYPKQGSSQSYAWHRHPCVPPTKMPHGLHDRLKIAVANLAKQWTTPPPDRKATANGGSSSSTFGQNDILTLSWHLDIFAPTSPLQKFAKNESSIVYEAAKRLVAERIIRYADATSGFEGVLDAFNSEREQKRIVIDSAYNLLRFVRCMKCCESEFHSDNEVKLTRARDRAFYRFQSRLHDQLSYYTITDSRFDASEVAFCLEGMLILRPNAVNDALIERVMDVMEKSQQSAPYWPSDMPMVADHKGQVLYPSSVEIAKSLLCSLSIFDQHNGQAILQQSAGTRYLHLVKRYWRWLKTRRTAITLEKNERVIGWHSEHLNDPALAHTWETSQILEFCLMFRDQVLRHISRNLLLTSGLNVTFPRQTSAKDWQGVVDKFEPVTSLGKNVKVYELTGEHFITPHLDPLSSKPYWSALLYGPPGTGKTEFASNIADHLGVPLITITVSDFLAEGEGRMETRAKLVFDVLTRQTMCVVIFDELDQFLLDRDSKRFRDQDSAFQFLTPGMLTKLATLRKKANLIFIVSTNYEERIDPAIKRAGRIDHKYLVLPPDANRRLKILEGFPSVGDDVRNASPEERTKLIGASAFLGYKDLERVAQEKWRDMPDFIERLSSAPRNIQFYSYKSRFSSGETDAEIDLHNGPRDELLCLFRLAQEAWGVDQQPWFNQAGIYETCKTFQSAIVRNLIGQAENRSKSSFIKELTKENIALPDEV